MTYFSLLDKDSLFALLLRLHYDDLWNLCKTKNYLYKITCTPHFQDEWTKYNIRTEIVTVVDDRDHDYQSDAEPTMIEHRQVDRLNRQHGSTDSYFEDETLYSQCDYVAGVKQGHELIYEGGLLCHRIPYVQNVKHGARIAYYNHCEGGSLDSYVNGKFHGLDWSYGVYLRDQCYSFQDGIYLKWHPNGGLKEMGFHRKGYKHGIQREWFETGIKQREYTMVNGSNKGPSYQWDESGELIRYDEF
jgi:antitoxin component YwqK of YwqJK toxin-antitoxin module